MRADSKPPALYYETTGTGGPVVLIHPSGATASTWGDLADRLAAFGQVIVYDRRGYGRSPGEPLPSIGAHTADLATLLDNLGVTDAVISGTSIGATIAIDLARLRPDLVRAVVAHESPWHVTRQPPTFAQMAALSKMTWLSSRGRPADAVAAFLRFAYHYRDGGSAWDRFPDAWRQAAADNAEASLADIRIAIGGYPATKDLSTVSRPVVCTCGSRSAPTMTRVTRKLARVLPAGVFHQIEGAGHAAPFDAPAAFSELIAESVTRV